MLSESSITVWSACANKFFPWFSPMAEIISVDTVTSAEKCWRKRATETHTHIQEGGKSTKKANCLVVDMTVQSPRLSPPAVPKTVFALPSQWRRPQVPKLNVAFHLYALIFFFSQVYYFIMWTWSLNTSLHSSNLGDSFIKKGQEKVSTTRYNGFISFFWSDRFYLRLEKPMSN